MDIGRLRSACRRARTRSGRGSGYSTAGSGRSSSAPRTTPGREPGEVAHREGMGAEEADGPEAPGDVSLESRRRASACSWARAGRSSMSRSTTQSGPNPSSAGSSRRGCLRPSAGDRPAASTGCSSGTAGLPTWPRAPWWPSRAAPSSCDSAGDDRQVASVCPPSPGTDGIARAWNGVRKIAPFPGELLAELERMKAARGSRPLSPVPRPTRGSDRGESLRPVRPRPRDRGRPRGRAGHAEPDPESGRVQPGPARRLRLARTRGGGSPPSAMRGSPAASTSGRSSRPSGAASKPG